MMKVWAKKPVNAAFVELVLVSCVMVWLVSLSKVYLILNKILFNECYFVKSLIFF